MSDIDCLQMSAWHCPGFGRTLVKSLVKILVDMILIRFLKSLSVRFRWYDSETHASRWISRIVISRRAENYCLPTGMAICLAVCLRRCSTDTFTHSCSSGHNSKIQFPSSDERNGMKFLSVRGGCKTCSLDDGINYAGDAGDHVLSCITLDCQMGLWRMELM